MDRNALDALTESVACSSGSCYLRTRGVVGTDLVVRKLIYEIYGNDIAGVAMHLATENKV